MSRYAEQRAVEYGTFARDRLRHTGLRADVLANDKGGVTVKLRNAKTSENYARATFDVTEEGCARMALYITGIERGAHGVRAVQRQQAEQQAHAVRDQDGTDVADAIKALCTALTTTQVGEALVKVEEAYDILNQILARR